MQYRFLVVLSALVMSTVAIAQKKVGDFIESQSYNDDKRGAKRTMNYQPVGREIVCINGNNRYTRALYGGYTDYRVETSDRPVFAVVKKGHHRNIQFMLAAKPEGPYVALDSVEYCKATYINGMRSYILRDRRWGRAEVTIDVVALADREGGIWRFNVNGIDSPVVSAIVRPIAIPRLHRNGDMGADKPGCLEADKKSDSKQTHSWLAKGTTYFSMLLSEIQDNTSDTGQLFEQTVERNRIMASRITFSTPDPYINPLGGALVMAADGNWDGQTWLHGCIGWRMPLAGWRAGYLGDVLGWNDRAECHFDAYAKSQVTNVTPTIPHPSQDSALNMARAVKRWGTQMYSNGYICRNPERNNQMHHYDMNLNYMDELMWHFSYNADTAYMRRMWPVIESHLAWEKRNFDPDGDHLYDAYCCIWASDALYYSGGAVTHSTAYNYRANRMAARIAQMIGKDGSRYDREADAIQAASDSVLWLPAGHWAEYKDRMGKGRKHESAALWSVYTPIDCGLGTMRQWYDATRFVDREIPHIPVVVDGKEYGHTISTTNWLPYSWSINNVAAAEVMHTALAYYEAGRPDAAFTLMKANIIDQMYAGGSPANFGQISFYDAARGECYRDFGDCIGISSRTLLQGLFGIRPDALNDRCLIHPGFPSSWDSASVATPYLSYSFRRSGGKDIYEITQHFAKPLAVVIRQNLGNGQYRDIIGSADEYQTIEVPTVTLAADPALTEKPAVGGKVFTDAEIEKLGLSSPEKGAKYKPIDISRYFNSSVSDIYNNRYLSPRPPYTTLQIPVQGIGEWCHPQLTADINDSVFRSRITRDRFEVMGVPFQTPAKGSNIIYTSLWDNYPNSVSLPLSGKAHALCLLMAGSTNHMQSRIANAHVIVEYADHSSDTLTLTNPDNWCPIEQDYFVDNLAFSTASPRPIRLCLGTGDVSRDLGKTLSIKGVYGREIPGGAAQMLRMVVDPNKKLRSLTISVESNDIVVGLMAITKEK